MEEEAPKVQKKKRRTVLINIAYTQYQIVKTIAKRAFHWKLTKEEDSWDVLWTDGGVTAEFLSKMKPYQKINHFPGMYEISRKNNLARNLNKLKKFYPKDFKFYPRTWLIPSEMPDLKLQGSRKKMYIAKPEASCQGRGIFLTNRIEDFSINDRYVLQEYVSNPLLIDGLKFDFRIYVLVAGCDPLRIYIHKEGLARFATEEYTAPNPDNIVNQCMHLTNYAINKHSDNFVSNEDADADDVGHKRSITSTMEQLAEEGYNTDRLWERIKIIVIKTLCSIQPTLAHTYKACQPDDPTNSMCFEILGFDILIDNKLKPWLLEVNHSPSFSTDSPLDNHIKTQVITEALRLIKISAINKKVYLGKLKEDLKKRAMSKRHEIDRELRESLMSKAQAKRDKWENTHLGGYTKIYPCENSEKYTPYLETARKVWEDWTGSRPRPVTLRAKPKAQAKTVYKSYDLSEQKPPRSEVFDRLSKPVQRDMAPIVYGKLKLPDAKTHMYRQQVASTNRIEPVKTIDYFAVRECKTNLAVHSTQTPNTNTDGPFRSAGIIRGPRSASPVIDVRGLQSIINWRKLL